MITRNIAH